jgi:hypothetical protein
MLSDTDGQDRRMGAHSETTIDMFRPSPQATRNSLADKFLMSFDSSEQTNPKRKGAVEMQVAENLDQTQSLSRRVDVTRLSIVCSRNNYMSRRLHFSGE